MTGLNAVRPFAPLTEFDGEAIRSGLPIEITGRCGTPTPVAGDAWCRGSGAILAVLEPDPGQNEQRDEYVGQELHGPSLSVAIIIGHSRAMP